MLKPCADCGELSDATRCELHRKRSNTHEQSAHRRGYGRTWRALSREARRLQPWCSDCGSREDLTADHLRHPARTLADVDVVCRSCNGKRDPIRGERGVGDRERPGDATLADLTETGERRADPRLSREP